MKPYTPNMSDGNLRIMHTLRGVEIGVMERLHRELSLECGRELTRPDVLRIAVFRELTRQEKEAGTRNADATHSGPDGGDYGGGAWDHDG